MKSGRLSTGQTQQPQTTRAEVAKVLRLQRDAVTVARKATCYDFQMAFYPLRSIAHRKKTGDLAPVEDKVRIVAPARSPAADIKNPSYTTRARLHHDHPVRKVNRLLDIMRHHDDGAFSRFQIASSSFCRWPRVSEPRAPSGSSSNSSGGRGASPRAIAARCDMPRKARAAALSRTR